MFNKHKLLHVFLKFAKVDIDEVIPTNSKPRYEQPPITIYEPEEIQKLLDHADSYMALVISMAYGLGLRERELMHAEFSDILTTRVFVVQSKPRFKFTTKTHEHRKIAIHSDLYERLMGWQRQYPNRRLILGVAKGFDTPNTGLLGPALLLFAEPTTYCWLGRVHRRQHPDGDRDHAAADHHQAGAVRLRRARPRWAFVMLAVSFALLLADQRPARVERAGVVAR